MSDLAVTFDSPFDPAVPATVHSGPPRPVRRAAVLLYVLAGLYLLDTVSAYAWLAYYPASVRDMAMTRQLPYTVVGLAGTVVLALIGWRLRAGRPFARYFAFGAVGIFGWGVLSSIAMLISNAIAMSAYSSDLSTSLWTPLGGSQLITVAYAVLAVFVFRALVSAETRAWFAEPRPPAPVGAESES